ncbi:MAG: hypothetical protein UDB11_10985 [Peptococcaceae bacterium]|nr:hypothetical protein [Peptococcaceae bacterium]
MAIHAALLEPARSCSANLDELIKKLREIKVSGCLNIFSYASGQNELNKEKGVEVRALLEQAKADFDEFQKGLENDKEWHECFSNPAFYERSIAIIGERLHAVDLSKHILTVITQLENISNNMNGTLETFIEFSCVDGPIAPIRK